VTLLELRAALASLTPPTRDDVKLRNMFVARVDAWPTDSTTPAQLLDEMNRLLGNVWFSTTEIHQQAFEALEAFAQTVRDLGGMTVNERLYFFGLFDKWDASSEADQKAIQSKIRAG
jgi:hypothetical protein